MHNAAQFVDFGNTRSFAVLDHDIQQAVGNRENTLSGSVFLRLVEYRHPNAVQAEWRRKQSEGYVERQHART